MIVPANADERGSQGRRVVVIGGGITGLAAAHRVIELASESGMAVELVLLEASGRLGGTILTQRRDGFLIEGGPDSFITQKPWALDLCRRLGIEDRLISTHPAYRRTFVVRDGAMHPVPEGFLLLAPTRIRPFLASPLFSWRGKLRMAMDLIIPAKQHGDDGDESLASFVRRRFGREALERVAQPLVSGIYTADPAKLSLRATMPRFLEMESAHGSLIRAMGRASRAASAEERGDSGARYSMFVSFADGMAALIDALARQIPAGVIRTGTRVRRITREGRSWRLALSESPGGSVRCGVREGASPDAGTVSDEGASLEAEAVIVACPAHAAAELLGDVDAMLAAELGAIPYANSATLSLAMPRHQVPHPLDGFGFVVPTIERRTLIAVTFSSVKFAGRAPDGWVLMRAFLGGAMHPDVYELSDDALREAVLRDLRDLLGIWGEPRFTAVHRWPASMPQYPVGHLDRVRRIGNRLAVLPGLAVAGNALGGVGIPDCVRSGEQAAERVMRATLVEAS